MSDKQDEFIEVSKLLGEDIKYLHAIPEHFFDYAMSIVPTIKEQIKNLKSYAKYTLQLEDSELDEFIVQNITRAFVQSDKAKKYNIEHGINIQP